MNPVAAHCDRFGDPSDASSLRAVETLQAAETALAVKYPGLDVIDAGGRVWFRQPDAGPAEPRRPLDQQHGPFRPHTFTVVDADRFDADHDAELAHPTETEREREQRLAYDEYDGRGFGHTGTYGT